MGPRTRWSWRVVAAAVVLVALAAVVVVAAGVVPAPVTAGAASRDDPPVTRRVFGPASPTNAPGQSLLVQEVTIAPGATLPEHFHQGTQVATIRSGVLTYDVTAGTVQVLRKDGTREAVPGPATLRLRRGDTIVEDESLVHHGSNGAKGPVRILIASLLHRGADLSAPIATGTSATTNALELDTTLSSQARALTQVGPSNESTYGTNRLTGSSTLDGLPVGVEMQAYVQYTSGSGPFFGFVTFTFADGSTLGVSMQGYATATGAGGADASFAATLGVIGGTGRYVNATGFGTFTGQRTAALGGDVGASFTLDLS